MASFLSNLFSSPADSSNLIQSSIAFIESSIPQTEANASLIPRHLRPAGSPSNPNGIGVSTVSAVRDSISEITTSVGTPHRYTRLADRSLGRDDLVDAARFARQVLPEDDTFERWYDTLGIQDSIRRIQNYNANLEPTTTSLDYKPLRQARDRISDPYQTGSDPFPEHSGLLDHLYTLNHARFGSRALGVGTDYSDFDIAISAESDRPIVEKLISLTHPANINAYAKFKPESGFVGLYQFLDTATNCKVDVLVTHTDEDLDTIRSAVSDIQQIPSYLLTDKKFRIDVYQKALKHRGWRSHHSGRGRPIW